MKIKALNLTAALLLGLMAVVAAGAEEPTALSIMQAVYDRPQPADTSGLLTMTLIDAKGKERVRSLDQRLATFGGVEKKIMEFLSPADVKGTSFMNWSYDEEGRSDDQWIYLPALKRVKRISSDSKGDAFMGSDFTYDDLAERHPSRDTHTIIGTESLDGEACWIIESKAKDTSEVYSKTVSWISKDRLTGIKRDYYDRKGALLKTLTVQELKTIDGYLMITVTEMHTIRKNTRTRMVFDDLKLDTGITDDLFSERTLTRGL
ncbi:MAG: outer membrane lipoprotein-sorting protein [Spirochaetia bacterium]|jgi:outer membrane lipoprotein-sorting protein|nr:outer membrane lipoprotein-sorting protein [Spirochaetia bacterium]